MWDTIEFKTALELREWITANEGLMQWEEIAVNNAYGVLYRPLRILS